MSGTTGGATIGAVLGIVLLLLNPLHSALAHEVIGIALVLSGAVIGYEAEMELR